MTTIRILHCIYCESVQEVEGDNEPTFSVYKTSEGKDVSICQNCKDVIIEVIKECAKAKKN